MPPGAARPWAGRTARAGVVVHVESPAVPAEHVFQQMGLFLAAPFAMRGVVQK